MYWESSVQKYDGADHPIAFYSKKLDRHERGWPTHEKELLAIKVATEKWRHYLHGRPSDVYTDNAACSWMLHHPRVSPKMARFLTHFSQYTFTLHHVRGKMNVVADALSRPPPEGLEDEEEKEPPLPDETYTQVNTVDYHFVSPHLAPETKRAFQRGYEEDPAFKQQWLEDAQNEKFVKHDGLLFFKQKKGETVYRMCVPNVKQLRTNVTIEFMMESHQRILEVDARTSKQLNGLPVSEGFDAILVAVDKLSKRAKDAPTYSTADAKDTADVFFDAVVRHHRLPKVIISERDSKYISDFWKPLMKLMGIKLSMTTAHRAQADGQTERQNLVHEDALRSEMKDLLQSENDVTLAEFAKNLAKERQEIVARARQNLKVAQARQKEYYDRKRRQVVFKEGDLVLLDMKNLPLHTENQNTELKKAKLAAKKVGPFVIGRMVNDNVAKLILPHTMKRLNATFNVELLTHYLTNREDFPNRPIPKALPLILDEDTGEELYVVEKLLKKRTRRRKR
ncbi:unnamed protein product [Phytophthora fragariaefolia]|uniref:Unnamed protein product n=1 Tax=Phytophthora fragariaefolia TaxID=1490495 RepID=A0A9W7CQT2_9STRA|nr:unnamed protein product [Phytophthora fragariaefolia]